MAAVALRFGKRPGRWYDVDYNTVFVDITHDRVFRVGDSKSPKQLFVQFQSVPGGDEVRDVVMDLSEGFRQLSRALFPNARITADKFHVLKRETGGEIPLARYCSPLGRLCLSRSGGW